MKLIHIFATLVIGTVIHLVIISNITENSFKLNEDWTVKGNTQLVDNEHKIGLDMKILEETLEKKKLQSPYHVTGEKKTFFDDLIMFLEKVFSQTLSPSMSKKTENNYQPKINIYQKGLF